ncbi:helix-turn-helix domain-containing protein [Alicyclobacillus fastidiosus]|uniref:helix-turn-helix domain-containing protein n=1 Tax=Alicyclobacillus fastidiosus TaxID=392011 RepID=UPI0023E9F27E|nr:hypothetical protein GCM10025859_62390 [Alicyclobacillus fastidiosus]GMA65871.1 hypothetical protein GCM10025859_63120 [Alicyclobacillus fastidiosus]
MRVVRDNPAVRLRVIMTERNMTVQHLSFFSGVSERTITALRSNYSHRKPNMDTIYRICNVLDVHPNDIWSDC